MSFLDLDLEISYESTEETVELVDEFYIPVLGQSVRYYRIAGFFSSTSLIVASEGIEALINNGGKMYLLISPELSQGDFETIRDHGTLNENLDMFSDLDLDSVPNENLKALAWLLDKGKLEIKIVVGKKAKISLFHQKVGIFFDADGNSISFSGSINETAQAWLNNIEEFKVFRSWEPGQIDYLQSDLNKFLSYWKNEKKETTEVYGLPIAIKNKIIKQKPRDIWDLNVMRRYRKDKKSKSNNLNLFKHQLDAVNLWVDNRYRLLMEMATGTGKTRAAIGCIVEKLKDNEQLCIIIATPQTTLTRQWESDFEELDIETDKILHIDGSVAQWKKKIEILLLDLSDKKYKNAVIFTTHALACKKKFIDTIIDNKFNTKIMFICDEVHAIGSAQQKEALRPEYEYRVGLSATPERMFDDTGTNIIRNYFGNKSFEFTIDQALHTINPLTGVPFLNAFRYEPIFVPLTEEEMKSYASYSRKIIIMKQYDDYDPDELQRLYDQRAKIGKNAENKFPAFEKLLDDLKPDTISDTILFASDKQISRCFEIMSKKRIRRSKITEHESASHIVNSEGETERQEIISQFKRHQLQVLVGLKCLDEGIDIKTARVAILMSNSTNPREYIQRVGRVIRPSPGKRESIIYDFIVMPGSDEYSGAGILEKEARRANQIAINATNYDEVKIKFEKNGVVLNAD
jgi:superfamily II DNA or RNA helicase